MAQRTITVPFPHMALNSHNVPPPDYQMQFNCKVPAGALPADLVATIAACARRTRQRKLSTVIFNAHGAPGYIAIGKGVKLMHTPLFRELRGKVGRIWIVACKAGGQRAGRDFCGALAMDSGAWVLAASVSQRTGQRERFPDGVIDDFERPAYWFSPSNGRPSLVPH